MELNSTNMNIYPLVKFKVPDKDYKDYPFSVHDTFVMLGEIKGMEGHCVVANFKTGQIYSGYHTDNFVELTEEEL